MQEIFYEFGNGSSKVRVDQDVFRKNAIVPEN
jgi:hypothetical protein